MYRLASTSQNKILAGRFPAFFSLGKGTPVRTAGLAEKGFEIRPGGEALEIAANTPRDFFRALGELMALAPGETVRKRRVIPAMDFRGLMIDCSRNGVMRPEVFTGLVPDLALMGFSHLCMYTEDTFEVEGHPLIGYRRGRYSKLEMREMDRAAAGFGMEMYPCIQTLGHLSQILKFGRYGKVRDTEGVLSVTSSETYQFLEDLIRSASEPYASKLINIGMDETWDLGRGSTFTPGKAIEPRKMYLEHVKKVAAICARLGLKPMMWGDILMHGNLGGPSHLKSQGPRSAPIPKGMDVIYWNYWSEDRQGYGKNIDKCRAWGFEPMIAPGVLSEDRHWSFQPKMELACGAFMETAKSRGIRRAVLTRWGDNGDEAPFRSTYPALAFFAQHCWRHKPAREQTHALLEAVTGARWADFVEPVKLECLDEQALHSGANPAKALLFDDPLLRLYGVHVGKTRLTARLKAVTDGPLAAAARRATPANRKIFRYIHAYGEALSLKADLGNDACAAYLSGDKARLRRLLPRVSQARRKVQALWKAHRAVWLEEKKAFGMEVLDIRYGGVLNRLEALKERLGDYLAGKVPRIEEFEEPGQSYLGKFPNIFWLWRTYEAVSTITTGK